MVASVPELTRRTSSMLGSSLHNSSAISISASVGAPNDRPFLAAAHTAATTSGCAWPATIAPQEPM